MFILTRNPNNNILLQYKDEMRSCSLIVTDSKLDDSQVNVTLVVRLLPVAEELRRCEHGVFILERQLLLKPFAAVREALSNKTN